MMLQTDGYKLDHRRQFVPGSTRGLTNLTARKGRLDGFDGIVYVGGQYLFDRFFNDEMHATFFNRPVDEVCDVYQAFLNDYVPGNTIGTDHVRALHDLDYLPLRFRSLPEGSYVPYGVPFFTVENTLPDFLWLTNYFATLISSVLWKPITSATMAREYRKVLQEAVDTAGVPAEFVPFQAHDFSFRGMSCPEDAALSGLGHLVYFTGSDCLPAVRLAQDYYHATGFIAGTVPATEHAVMCSGTKEDERETYRRLLEDVYPSGFCSIVSDTWNLWDVLLKIIPSLHDLIMNRDGTFVVRPDSGDPVKILCGDPDADPNEPEFKGVVELLWDEFGGSVNDKGFKVLDSHVGAIYGDSITLERAKAIRDNLMAKGFCPTVVLGVGSFTYQYVTRDTHGMAMKMTWVLVDGEDRRIWKDPITDYVNGVSTKKSAKGRVVVQQFGEDFILHDNLTLEEEEALEPINALRVVWEDGVAYGRTTLDEIRQRAL